MTTNSVLIIGYVWVEPHSSAAGCRMLQLIQLFLAQGWKVTFASPAQKGEKIMNLRTLGVDEVTIALNNSSFDDFLKSLVPSIVLFDRFMMEEQFGWRVAEHCPKALRILDTEDLHCLRKTRETAMKKNEDFSLETLLISDIAKREIAAILRCDLSIMISTYEMELLKNLFKVDESLAYHLPFMLPKINAAIIDFWKPFEERHHFTIIGNFLHAPNVDAVLLLKKTIWKLIKSKLPNAELHVYGAYATQQILQLHNEKEGFLIKGYTTDPEKVVKNSRLVLAPLRFGAGIKGKLTEAMQCGTPSITTSIGAEGMHDNLPWNGFVTDDFADFAEKAIELYTDASLWKEQQRKGVEIINQLYDKEKIAICFIEKIKELQENLTTHRTQNFMGNVLQHHTLQSTKYMSKWIEEKHK